jgi:predicted phage-related endonuclease
MTREIIQIENEAQWLEARSHDLTSTAISALFDVSPYTTRFELYHAHKNGLHLPFDENERVKKGKRMEQHAAEEVALSLGAVARSIDWYARIPGERMGSSFDYELEFPDGELVLLELKAVDHFRHKETWIDDEAPPHIEIQVQHQFECADKYERGYIAAFTGIYDFTLYERVRDRAMGAGLRAAAKKFWDDTDASIEPAIDFYRDSRVLDLLYKDAGGEPIDATKDAEMDALIAKHVRLGRASKAMDEERDAVKAEIHRRLENAGGAYTEHGKVVAKWTAGSAGKLITPDAAGTTINARAPYRQCITKILNEKK